MFGVNLMQLCLPDAWTKTSREVKINFGHQVLFVFLFFIVYYLDVQSFHLHLSRLVFWHQEVASGPFCFLVNSSWLLIFILLVFSIFISGFNLYCWKGIHFSFSLDLVFLLIFFVQIICFHYWFRDLLRELLKKYELLLIALFLGFLLLTDGLLPR